MLCLFIMPTLLESRPMARQEKNPDEVVRFPAAMTVADRTRLRIIAAHLGRPMEDLAGEWIVERLAVEESRLGLPSPGKRKGR